MVPSNRSTSWGATSIRAGPRLRAWEVSADSSSAASSASSETMQVSEPPAVVSSSAFVGHPVMVIPDSAVVTFGPESAVSRVVGAASARSVSSRAIRSAAPWDWAKRPTISASARMGSVRKAVMPRMPMRAPTLIWPSMRRRPATMRTIASTADMTSAPSPAKRPVRSPVATPASAAASEVVR